ncbi:MAG: methyl-accepting chemotaxis protein [Saccharospirillum sp.]
MASIRALLEEKQASINNAFPGYAQEIAYFTDLIINAIAAPDNLFQSHRRFIELNAESEQLLTRLNDALNQSMAAFSELLDGVRALNYEARDQALGAVDLAQTLTLALLAVGLTAAALILTSVVQSIRKPLNRTLSTLAHLAEGDLSRRITPFSQDEMGQIGKDVNALAQRLSEVIGQIHQSSRALAQVSEKTSDMSGATLQQMEQQQAQTASVATAVTEMEAAVREVAENAENTRSAIADVMESAQENMGVMETSVALSAELNEAQNAVSQVVTTLNQESQEIGSILDVILGMAEQTNLLALNAAIEAARAGEHGRGFAVVADEVRALSNRSSEAAAEIQTRIASLQKSARSAAEKMKEQVALGHRTAEQSRVAGASLSTMVGQLNDVNDMSHSIATASEEQSAVANEVSQSMTQISDMADAVAGQARDAAENAGALSQLADQQRGLIDQFRIAESEQDTPGNTR